MKTNYFLKTTLRISAIVCLLFSLNLSTAQNLAKGKTATQSSTLLNGEAKNAVDGNTDGNWNNKSITHSDANSAHWWEVDLGQVHNIGSIKIFNRTDCCQDRLKDIYIIVSESPIQVTDWQTIPIANYYGFKETYEGANPIVFTKYAKGRYIRILRQKGAPLSLAEVEVYGGNPPVTTNPKPPQSPIATNIGQPDKGFVRINSFWKKDQYINNENKTIASSTILTGWLSAMWVMEPVENGKYFKFKNRWTNEYIHNQNQKLEIGAIQPGWWSAMWELEPYGKDLVYIKNRFTGDYLHLENGPLALGKISKGWNSAMWSIQGREAVSPTSVPTSVPTAAPNPSNQTPGEVTFFNESGYVAKYFLLYTVKGEEVALNTGPISLGVKRKYDIPANATNIRVKGEAVAALKSTIFENTYASPLKICFKTYGTIFNPQFNNNCQ
jgi:F5/8 type C domain